ncbi:ATP phosphoribosyltransferase [Bacillus sp. SLBN-46]|uniref:hypothetical protein n=1 Tax=Bacillus sp. SLBN-46 TaxID=3042283 RepID=UPI0028625882|nr:hypothetical protein [Bacillus sp. SLBN-46]MDR6121344.1 ATP phosphoribosyltransferase [Bacillus sp. SLBN-46]
MGSLEHIEQLEAHIDDLGKEIKRVKKASDYLKLIEQFQSEIKNTSATLGQSRDQLKIYQEIMESKLELFQATSKNIDVKQQSIEQVQLNILKGLTELKRNQEKGVNELTSSLTDVSKTVNQNHQSLVDELKRGQEAQSTLIHNMSKTNKIFFIINAALLIVVGVLVFI